MLASLLIGAGAPADARGLPGGLAPSYSNLAWFLVAFELGPWEEYLISELTPDLERLTGESPAPVTWLSLDEAMLLPDFAVGLMRSGPVPAVLSFRMQNVAANLDLSAPNWSEGQRLERSLLMPGVTTQVSDRSALTVSAVFATQRFVAAGMNLSEHDGPLGDGLPVRSYHGADEVSYGAGMRFALSGELMQHLTLEAAFQSRIGMSEFASVQGVHGSSAELDIPSRIQMALRLQASPRTSLNFGVSQIFYSEVGAFPSRALPARFNALLGDSTSPQFDWEDLVVYSMGWSWRHESATEVFMDYRTRSQPRPSAPSLAAALGPELAQNALLVGLNRNVGDRSRIQFSAAYAPPEYAFGGNVLGVVSDRLDQAFEVQAMWRYDF